MDKKIKLSTNVEYDGRAFKLKDEYVNSKEFKNKLEKLRKSVQKDLKTKENENG